MKEDTQCIWLEETRSTNDYIKEHRKKLDFGEGVIVATKNQTAGRGQSGNSWQVEPRMNLTFSILLKPTFIHAEHMFIISELISVVITEFLNTIHPGFKIKWPNDLYFGDKKIGGILVENQLMGAHISHSIIGIGLNINQDNFPESLPNPISLKQITGNDFSLSDCLDKITEELMANYRKLEQEEDLAIEKRYFDLLYRKDGFHWFKEIGQKFKAEIVTVMHDGQLILNTESNEQKTFYFKEVEFII